MTKAELIKEMEQFPDDAEMTASVRIFSEIVECRAVGTVITVYYEPTTKQLQVNAETVL